MGTPAYAEIRPHLCAPVSKVLAVLGIARIVPPFVDNDRDLGTYPVHHVPTYITMEMVLCYAARSTYCIRVIRLLYSLSDTNPSYIQHHMYHNSSINLSTAILQSPNQD
jgi:hypothetical protein